VAGEISVTTLDIGGTNVTSTAGELNILDGVTASTAELNILDGVTASAADINLIDGITNGTVIASKAIITDANKDISGGRNITISGELDAATLDISGDADIDGTANLDDTDIDGTLVVDGSNISLDSTSTLNIDNSNTSNGITIGTATSGVPISIGHSTSEVTVNDNLTVTGDLTVSGTTTTVNSTTVNLNDHNIVLDSGNSTSAVINGAGITLEGGTGTDATFAYSTTGPKFEIKLGSDYEDLQVDQLIAASLDISGNIDVDGTTNLDVVDIDGAVDMASTLTVAGVVDITDTTDSSDATGDTGALRVEGGASIAKKLFVGTDADIDGTLEADAITVNGTALNTVIAGVTVTNATTAAVATTVTISDNESTNEDNAIIFTSGGDVDGGNIGLESDGDLTYNPSTGTVTATIFKGNIDAVDGDFDGTLEADAITVNGTALNTVIADEATALAIALG
jgi:cytoskeletal protein CcmA (bactofilin family)